MTAPSRIEHFGVEYLQGCGDSRRQNYSGFRLSKLNRHGQRHGVRKVNEYLVKGSNVGDTPFDLQHEKAAFTTGLPSANSPFPKYCVQIDADKLEPQAPDSRIHMRCPGMRSRASTITVSSATVGYLPSGRATWRSASLSVALDLALFGVRTYACTGPPLLRIGYTSSGRAVRHCNSLVWNTCSAQSRGS